jgi:hypothetical protein
MNARDDMSVMLTTEDENREARFYIVSTSIFITGLLSE